MRKICFLISFIIAALVAQGQQGLVGKSLRLTPTPAFIPYTNDSSVLMINRVTGKVFRTHIAGGGGSGVTTMDAIGAVPNANGASISGVTLTLQPANVSFGGLVTTVTQSFAGAKTFTNATTTLTNTIFNDNGSSMRISPPTGAFEIYTAGQSTDVIFRNSNATDGIFFDSENRKIYSETNLGVVGGNGVGSSLLLQSTAGVGTTSFIKFAVGNNGATEAMRIVNSGNVGVGTTSPSALLHALATSEQLRIGYNASQYYSTTVSSTGSTTFAATGSAPSFIFTNRLQGVQGADIASATKLVLGYDGTVFEVTGTTDIELISNVGWSNGAVITLIFNQVAVIKNDVTTSGNDITIQLDATANFETTPGSSLTLLLSEINGTQAWRQLSRMVR